LINLTLQLKLKLTRFRKYKALEQQVHSFGKFTIMPIRFEDRFDIMKWRNEQMYHLRQDKPLIEKDQNAYFKNVINKLFDHVQPNQILFSYLKNDTCIGYGGLVHINWVDKNAEISFIMNTQLEKEYFKQHWSTYLKLIEEVAFTELNIHKIFTYAYDLRPMLFDVLSESQYVEEGRLREHIFIEKKATDVLIHSKINRDLTLSKATEKDLRITFAWASDPQIRQHSFNNKTISFLEHKQWYSTKLNNQNCYYYLLNYGCQKAGSIRVDINPETKEGVISYLIDPTFQGQGFGIKILELLEPKILSDTKLKELSLKGLVMPQNIASLKIFSKLNYQKSQISDKNTYCYTKTISK
jgi:RimJ/RimL family protein N-acetyltransferase